MRTIRKISFFLLFVCVFAQSAGYSAENLDIHINPKLIKSEWDASWICYPEIPYNDYGIYHFRKSFELKKVPGSFIINISADNRYRLYCNGKKVSTGSARGDLLHWKFDTIDIADYLKAGNNTLAVVVWNFGTLTPIFQFSVRTGLIIQGNSEAENVVNTDKSWKCFKNEAYTGIPIDKEEIPSFCVIGPGDYVDGSEYPWGWEQPGYDTKSWKRAEVIGKGAPRGTMWRRAIWALIPRNIPMMEETEERLNKIVKQEGIKVSNDFLKGGKPFTVPSNSKVKLILDRGHLTTAYPEIVINGGKNAEIKLKYAEAFWIDNTNKGNRNEIEGKKFVGYYDIFVSDGGKKRTYSTLYWRTYRYIQMEITTREESLTVKDFKGIFTAYPLVEKASFKSSKQDLKKIWDVGWRTARLCANETYFDCPYYEQLAYIGDTRIQAMISLYVAGDDRIVRNAIEQFDDSRTSEGITYSRYPSHMPQFIPTYSLDWIGMVYDYWQNRDNSGYVKKFLPGMRTVLSWYEGYLNDNNLLKKTPWWEFIDWTDEFKDGIPPQTEKGESSIISLRFAATLREAADIEERFGSEHNAIYYRELAGRIINSVYRTCWDENKKMLADTPEKSSFTQHANIWIILLDVIPENEQKDLLNRILADETITRCSFYYQYYLHLALKKTGFGDRYLKHLKPWFDMLDIGLTTFAEKPEPTRSDCHAWSAHPNFFFLCLICGIEPSAPGFEKVKIAPNLGSLEWAKGEMPHPKGMIRVEYKRTGDKGIEAVISLPKGLTGTFVWKGKKADLKAGRQEITF